jgi:alpha-1,6-mannosyltransferase
MRPVSTDPASASVGGLVSPPPTPVVGTPSTTVERLRVAAGSIALAGAVLASAALAVGAAGGGRWFYVPASVHGGFPDWVAGPLHGLRLPIAPSGGALLLIALALCYAVVLGCARTLPLRRVAIAIVLAHVAFLLAPPLFSSDVFGYLAYARLDALHGFNPYAHGAGLASHDPVFPFIAWHDLTTPYGPLFTLTSLPFAWLGVPAGLWAMKLLAVLLSLACVGLVARIARRRELAPAAAIAFVGLNPLTLAYAVGGAHNDLLLMALLLAALLLAVEGRERAGGAVAILAASAKVSGALVLPFLIAGSERPRRALAGALAGAAAVSALAWAAFGTHAFELLSQVREQQRFVAPYAVPQKVAELLGRDELPIALRIGLEGALAAALLGLLWATWRRRVAWIAAAGWATLALLVTTAWLLPWYVIWLLPLAAVGGDRRLRLLTLVFCCFVLWTNIERVLI